jgi:hypothetical protein
MGVKGAAATIRALPAPGPVAATLGDLPGAVDLSWPRFTGASSFAIEYTRERRRLVGTANGKPTKKPSRPPRCHPILIPRQDKQNKAYRNLDKDERGPWRTSDLSARNYYGDGTYAITCPSGRVIAGPPTGKYGAYEFEKHYYPRMGGL